MSLGGLQWLFGERRRRNGTHSLMSTTHILRGLQRVTTARNGGVSVDDVMMGGGACSIFVYRELPLNVGVSNVLGPSGRTYFEGLERLVQFQPPAGDCRFVAVCVKPPGDCISLAPLGQFPLDARHGSTIEIIKQTVQET